MASLILYVYMHVCMYPLPPIIFRQVSDTPLICKYLSMYVKKLKQVH